MSAEPHGVSTPAVAPHMLRHAFVTTMLDAGVDLRDVQIHARHACDGWSFASLLQKRRRQ